MTSREALVNLIIEAESPNENIKRTAFLSNQIERDLEKLEQLEGKEDLYGIDLFTLLKTEEVYWRIKYIDCSEYSEIEKSYKCYIDLHNHQLIVYSNEYDEFGYPLPFEEYGDTWALTMEELENDQ